MFKAKISVTKILKAIKNISDDGIVAISMSGNVITVNANRANIVEHLGLLWSIVGNSKNLCFFLLCYEREEKNQKYFLDQVKRNI